MVILDLHFTPCPKLNLKMPKDVSIRLEMTKLSIGCTEVLVTLAQGMKSLICPQKHWNILNLKRPCECSIGNAKPPIYGIISNL